MLKIVRLYTEPEVTKPILFKEGVNLIIGDKSADSEKRNGVGKSVCVEFINFALFKKKADSRVNLIPPEVFARDTLICLDIEIEGKPFTIKRSLADSERPLIVSESGTQIFANLGDAAAYLGEKIVGTKREIEPPSFRKLLGPLLRDEESEFKSIVACYDTAKSVPDDYSPHLYYLGLDPNIYSQIQGIDGQLRELSRDTTRIKNQLEATHGVKLGAAKAQLNELDREVKVVELEIDQLKNIAGYNLVKDRLVEIETEVEKLRESKALYSKQLTKLRPFSKQVTIDAAEVTDFYSQLNEALGAAIKRELDEVLSFKVTIDEFQTRLINEQREMLRSKIAKIDKALKEFDGQYRKLLSIIRVEGELKSLKQTYAAFQKKSGDRAQLRAILSRHQQLDENKGALALQRDEAVLRLRADIQSKKIELEGFEQFILDIHEYIQGNRKASFQVKATENRQIVNLDMRIDSDGSWSINREKVFIYDIALLLSPQTRARHLGFLVHDNILNVDRDTFVRSLKYVVEDADFSFGQQYILTLNTDFLADFDDGVLDGLICAKFTKSNRFLGTSYQQSK